MELSNQLTVEQQFRLQVYAREVRTMSPELLQQHLIELLRHMMLKDRVMKQLFKEQLLRNNNKQSFDVWPASDA